MGQNNCILLGFLFPIPADGQGQEESKENNVSYARALIKTGDPDAGEVHPVLLTGKTVAIAEAAFQKYGPGFQVLAEGGIKTFNNQTCPVIHYLNVYEPEKVAQGSMPTNKKASRP